MGSASTKTPTALTVVAGNGGIFRDGFNSRDEAECTAGLLCAAIGCTTKLTNRRRLVSPTAILTRFAPIEPGDHREGAEI
jgi:hypothetical protein